MRFIKWQHAKQSIDQKYFYVFVQPSCAYMSHPVLSCLTVNFTQWKKSNIFIINEKLVPG